MYPYLVVALIMTRLIWISLFHIALEPINCIFHFCLSLLLEIILFYLNFVRLSVMRKEKTGCLKIGTLA